MNAKLLVYYDNPNPASDMYLKYINKDAEKLGVEVKVCSDPEYFFHSYLQKTCDGALVLLPTLYSIDKIKTILDCCPQYDIDGIGNHSKYISATATGIFNYIKETLPDRKSVIAVIGRGTVGLPLLQCLIDYGYTVISANSQTDSDVISHVLNDGCTNVVVGLSSKNNIINESMLMSNAEKMIFIDASHNFAFQNIDVIRCGKFTRQILFRRLLENSK